MKKTIFNCLLVLWYCTSCVQKFHARDFRPRHLPKEVPEMILTGETKPEDGSREIDSIGVLNYALPRFFISKYEITNEQFCEFLNVDSIRTNEILIKSIIDLEGKENKIFLTKKNRYAPVKGYGTYPVVLVSWWGARRYCEWLSAFVNKERGEKDLYLLPKYRLPAEYEWVSATTNTFDLSYCIVTMCDSAGYYSDTSAASVRSVTKDSLNVYGIGGMDENVYEWTEDNFHPMEKIMDFSMMSTYYEDITADAVVRKHGQTGINSCGRASRLRTGFYPNTGFRIVQTFMGRATGGEF